MIDRQKRGRAISIGDVFGGFDAFGASLVAVFLITSVGFLGLLLFIVPGLFVFAAWGYAPWFIALDGEGGIQALRSSWRLMRRRTSSVFLLTLIETLIQSAGAAVALGSLFTFPFGLLLFTDGFELTAVRQPPKA